MYTKARFKHCVIFSSKADVTWNESSTTKSTNGFNCIVNVATATDQFYAYNI